MVDFFEHIDEYKNNQLSAEDQLIFEEAMQLDPTLQAAVDNYDLVKEISLSFLDDEVREILNEKPNSSADSPKRNSKSNQTWVWKWVAILLLILILVFGYHTWSSFQKNKRIEIAMMDYTPPQVVFNRGLEQTENLSILDQAKDAFSKKDFAKSKELLLSNEVENSDQDQKNWLLGHIYFIEKDYENALTSLDKIKDETAFKDDVDSIKEKIKFIADR